MHTKIRVLVINDDELALAAIESILTRARYDVAVAHSGDEGMAQLLHNSFNVVVCNITMPEKKSGLRTLRGLKALAPTVPVVIVASSPIDAAGLNESSFDCLSATLELAGAKVIQKPRDGSDLVAAIYDCVAHRSGAVH